MCPVRSSLYTDDLARQRAGDVVAHRRRLPGHLQGLR